MDSTNIWSRKTNGASSVLSGSTVSSPVSITSPLTFGLSPSLSQPSLLPRANGDPMSTSAMATDMSNSGVSQSSLRFSGMFGGIEKKLDDNNIFASVLNKSTIDPEPIEYPLSYSTSASDHPLRYNWTLWFMHRSPGVKISDYEKATKEISSFSTAEDFWRLYSYLARPSSLPYTSEYHLFKTGVRPVWEDPTNVNGGKWILKLKKGTGSVTWESLLLAIIGGEFGNSLGEEVVGAVISIRREADIISVWNKQGNNGAINLKIRDIIRNVACLSNVAIEYKVHADSMKEGAEKMLAAKNAAASGEKPHRGRGSYHGAGTRHHNPAHISTNNDSSHFPSYSSPRGRGSHANRENHTRPYLGGHGGSIESNMEGGGGAIDRKVSKESQDDI
ncbi:translation initiation factor eIF 4e-like domain-containing protein [Lipomyces kononenkoae]|uniref:Translation initiation factor eIF 4e-like domain-containing protein n=1 Tax=Lipomyces kononenkoae TaxID=34357 RepID=A0ACC3T469_LIPKO